MNKHPWLNRCLALAALTALVALSGCGDDESINGSGDSSTTDTKRYEITQVVQYLPGNDFVKAQMCGVKSAAERMSVDLDVQGPRQRDAAEQVKVLNSVIATKPDAIIFDGVDGKTGIAPLRQAASQGIKVILVNQPLDDDSFITSQVLTNNLQGGRVAGKAMGELVQGKGKVLDLSIVPGIPGLVDGRELGFKQEIAKFPDIDDLGVEYDEGDDQKSAQVMAAVLTRDPDLAGLYLPAPVASAGTFNALRSADKAGVVKVVAYDPRAELVEEMRKGAIDAFVAQPVKETGEVALENAVAALDGEQVKKTETLDNVVIEKDQIDDPAFSQYFYKGC